MQAMILAAGFGTRLKPHSELRPKPLFPVLNRPLLPAIVDRLKNSGFTEITVNCHYLHEQVERAVGNIAGVSLQYEEKILGTGGALGLACTKMSDIPILVTNGDIYHTGDFRKIYQYHLDSDNDVTMVLHDCQRFNSVVVRGDRIADFPGKNREGFLAFTGIQVINPAVLSKLPQGAFSCIIQYYREQIAAGKKIGYLKADDIHWTDMGTEKDYLLLHGQLLHGKIPAWPELGAGDISSFRVDRYAEHPADCHFEDWVCIGRAKVEPGAVIKRSVIWDGAVVRSGSVISDAIITG